MNIPAEHLQAAQNHDAAARVMFEAREYSWTAVALFYCGMHLVHSALPYLQNLTTAQQHPESHTGTTFKAEGTSVVIRMHAPSIRTPYDSLFNASLDVRYNGAMVSREEARNHRRIDLTAIAEWASQQIAKGGDAVEPWLTALAGHELASGQ